MYCSVDELIGLSNRKPINLSTYQLINKRQLSAQITSPVLRLAND
jgi:hypothetical protein